MLEFRHLLYFIALTTFCDGFATTEKFVAFLPVFKNTKFHDIQISTALCITQYQFLQRNYPAFNGPKPNIYDVCPYYAWEAQLENWFLAEGYAEILKLIQDTYVVAVSAPDLLIAMDPTDHFDLESYIDRTNIKLLNARQNLINSLQSSETSKLDIFVAQTTLGTILHTVQDFYSHTNWVELGNSGINKNVGMGGDLGIAINTGTACNPCAHNFTNDEQADIDAAYSNAWRRYWLNKKGSKDNIYACKNNIATKLLTSGYHSEESSYGNTANGKCSHGGATDFFAPIAPAGGISKDSDTVVFAPHYDLHQKAANLAVQATIQYFEDLRISLDDEKLFGKLIGFDATATMSIMIDTTGSMENSIAAVKKFAEKMVTDAANKTSRFFLTPFNDPEYGPVISFTDPKQMVKYIETLTADGGGDTPEKCYSALLATVRAVPKRTNIYIFTDANSKNPELYPTIVSIANQKSLSISFMMSGETYGLSDDGKPVTAPGDYRKLSIGTNGQYVLAVGQEIQNVTNILTDTNWQALKFYTDVTGPFNSSFYVDNTIAGVEISITNSGYDLSYTVIDVIDKNGDSVITNTSAVVDNPYTKILRFSTDAEIASPWTLVIGSTGSYPLQITIRVQSSLSSKLTLITSSTQMPLQGSPLSNEKYDVYVICDQCTSINSIGVSSCTDNNPIMISQTPQKAGTLNWWGVQNVTLSTSGSSDNQFCISFTGTVIGNSTFTRIAKQKFAVTTLSLESKISTNTFNNSGQVYPNNNVSITYSVTNVGTVADSFSISVTSSVAFKIYGKLGNTPISANQTINGEIIINANGTIGTTSNVEVSISSVNDPSQYNTADFTIFIIDPNPDIYPPVCTVVNSTVNKCPTDPTQCATANYHAYLTFSDIGKGVNRVTYNDGSWNVTDTNLFNSTNAANHTFTASGIISCCNDTIFSVVDGAYLVGKCLIDVTYPGPTTTTITIPQTTTTTTTVQTTPASSASFKSYSITFIIYCLFYYFL